jgi:hypothetical protein
MRKNLYCGVDLHSNNPMYVITDEKDKQVLRKRNPIWTTPSLLGFPRRNTGAVLTRVLQEFMMPAWNRRVVCRADPGECFTCAGSTCLRGICNALKPTHGCPTVHPALGLARAPSDSGCGRYPVPKTKETQEGLCGPTSSSS